MAQEYNVESLRGNFPALQNRQNQIFFDNAGGTQVLNGVITSIQDYLTNNNVQHGGSYYMSKKCMDVYEDGYNAAASYINASRSEIVLGASVTQLFRNLSVALGPQLQAGDEIIISSLDHEANIASWLLMADQKPITVKWWTGTPGPDPILRPEDLKLLMSPKTKLVTCTHTSNLLGTITDVKAIAKVVHEVPGAKLCVDAVAFAPHRPVDVKDLEVDFYAFSWYKVFGPHISVLYASTPVHPTLTSLSHFFKPHPQTLETMLSLAGTNYELTSTLPAVTTYLQQPGFWTWSVRHEETLQTMLLDYLTHTSKFHSSIQIYGSPTPDSSIRVPVICWTVRGIKSKQLVEEIQSKTGTYGFKWGHNYSYRLVERLFKAAAADGNDEARDTEDGLVRVSLCHYNTVGEVQGFIQVIEEILEGKIGH